MLVDHGIAEVEEAVMMTEGRGPDSARAGYATQVEQPALLESVSK